MGAYHTRIAALALAAALIAAITLALRPGTALAPVPTSTGTRAAPGPATDAPPAPSPTPPPPTPVPTPVPTPAPQLTASAEAADGALTFRLQGDAPAGATEALLWFDSDAGRQVRRVPLGGGPISATVTIDAAEALAPGDLAEGRRLDYWWAVLGGGEPLRRAGTLALPPEIAAIGQAAPVTPQIELRWVERATPHFRLYATPGSAAERDLDRLAEVAEASYEQASAAIRITRPVSIPVYLVPRVFWQGGVAYGKHGPLIISYLDRNYAGAEPWSYFVHEVTHALGAEVLPQGAEVGGVLGEGLAVAAAGGHYSREPIDARAAALADTERYVPLCELRYDFYAAQHEAAYTQSASFVRYLMRTYGEQAFLAMYRAQEPQRGGREQDVAAFCEADERALVEAVGRTNADLEREWLAYLDALEPTEEQRQGWELTVRLFETMRRYQEQLDPAARLLPPPPAQWDSDETHRMLTPASGPRAARFETMLAAAGRALRSGDEARAERLLRSIEAGLDAGGTATDRLAQDYQALVELLAAQARALRLGDAQALARTLADESLAERLPFGADELLFDLRLTAVQLEVDGDRAVGVVRADGASLGGRALAGELFRAQFERGEGGWRLASWEPHRVEIAMPPGPAAVQ